MSGRLTVRGGVTLACLIAAATAVGAGEVRVAQKDKNFSVREVALKVNEPLVFINEDSVTHNVYSVTKGMEFEIRTQQPGQTDSIRFSHEGDAEVLCAIHPKMKLRVMVKP